MAGSGSAEREVGSRAIDASDFYDRLARFHDVLTNWPRRLAVEEPFWRRLFDRHRVRAILDAACGTGGHVIGFARWGCDVAGADLSARMIAIAAERAAAAGLDLRFIRAGFADLPQHFGPTFDAVLCVGNSLPHVLSDADLSAALAGMGGVLRPEGILIIQHLNYDLRWRVRPRFFPLRSGIAGGREALVWRMADYIDADPPSILFHTALFEKGEGGAWTVEVNSTPQRPYFRATLAAALGAAGFEIVDACGSFGGDAFDPDASKDLIVIARRA
ncbi:MAG: class I SAM-dependent methyltransferase [Planctomycetes bacterium]|nr:class I SAM-dependent methyltransferase [Planctomycetota bacterium]